MNKEQESKQAVEEWRKQKRICDNKFSKGLITIIEVETMFFENNQTLAWKLANIWTSDID